MVTMPIAIHLLVFGIHGWGVSTPIAAAVAACTAGFAKDLHIPKDAIFIPPAASLMVPIIWPLIFMVGALVAVNFE